jgi:protein-disulfide isomerase
MTSSAQIDSPVAPVSPLDHARGPASGGITLIEHGDYQCAATQESAGVVARLERQWAGRVRYIFRHFPQDVLHPNAWLAAEAAEAAAAQGMFWEMHAMLLAQPDAITEKSLARYARELRMDAPRFALDLSVSRYAGRVYGDYQAGCAAGVWATPTFFINGRRHAGANSIVSLSAAIEQEWFGHRSAPLASPVRRVHRISAVLIREIQKIAE